MKKYIYILLILFVSCTTEKQLPKANAGKADAGKQIMNLGNPCLKFKRLAIYCLRDWLIGEDAGGTWQQIGTSPQNISSLLIGQNPCIEWSPLACGQYNLMYIVGDACCRDTAFVNPLKCCLMGGSSCN